MNQTHTPAVSVPAAFSPTSGRPNAVDPRTWGPTSGRPAPKSAPSRKRTFLASLGIAAALATGVTVFAGVGEAQAKVRGMDAVTAKPGPITTPAGKVRCSKPGQYHVTVSVPVTSQRKGIRSAALWLQPTFHGDPVLIGRAKSKSRIVPVVGCFSPSQVQGLKRGPAYLIAVDANDGHRNVVRVRVSR